MSGRPGRDSPPALVRAASVGSGALAVVVAMSEVPAMWWWAAAPGAIGAVATGWRRTRWLAVLVPLSVVALSAETRTTSTAVLAGALVVAFLVLTDLAETLDEPDQSTSLPADRAAPESAQPWEGLAGWAHSAGVLWLSGALTAVAVGVAAGIGLAPVAALVLVTPVLAVLAAYLALGRLRL